MTLYADMTEKEITAELEALRAEYKAYATQGLSLDMSRGKPSAAQLDLSEGMLNVLHNNRDCITESGIDCRNYGVLDGIVGAKQLMACLLDEAPENIIVLGNSSLTAMYDCIVRCLKFGTLGSTPWENSGTIKFICPVPGYDRHFTILEQLGIEMIPVALHEGAPRRVCGGGICQTFLRGAGPDMDEVERLVASDPSIKGIWCVPKYSNPSGITYTDDVVRRLAAMQCAATDFRIFWDNAYAVHNLYSEPALQDQLLDIGAACVAAGNPNRYFKFASTSKVTFPGAGIAAFAASEDNIAETKQLIAAQMIGADKMNQLRHVRFFSNGANKDGANKDAGEVSSPATETFAKNITAHMNKQADIMRPKFELVQEKLTSALNDTGIASWTNPRGGYFVCFTGMDKTATRTINLAYDAGVILTGAGATWPYGKDPHDSQIRIAPSMPTLDELSAALDVFTCCAKIAALETLLETT